MMEGAYPRACSDGVCPMGSAFAAQMQRLRSTRKLIDELVGTNVQCSELPAKAKECWRDLRTKAPRRRLTLKEVMDLAFVAQINIRFRRHLDSG